MSRHDVDILFYELIGVEEVEDSRDFTKVHARRAIDITALENKT